MAAEGRSEPVQRDGAAPDGFVPDWPAPPGVAAWMSLRGGGVSAAPYATLNLGDHVGDRPEDVAENRRRFQQRLGSARPHWLAQVHGTVVVAADLGGPMPIDARTDTRVSSSEGPLDPATAGLPPRADASTSLQPGHACVVLVADCLPVLLADRHGRAVGAAHAGWRGLAGGVLEATVAALCQRAGLEPKELVAWLGPCIGPQAFEVGVEVAEAFGATAAPRFAAHANPDKRWADLPGLAADRLRALGLPAAQIAVDGRCTVADAAHFHSFRRDGPSGRMAAAVWRSA